MNGRHPIQIKWLLVIGIYLLTGSLLYSQMPETPKQRSPEFAAHLEQATNALKKIAADVPDRLPVPQTWDGPIKYYDGTWSSPYRVMLYGTNFNAPDNVPPAGKLAYSAFYYRRDGRLQYVVNYTSRFEPFLANQILYRDQVPIACGSYCLSGRPIIDYVHYEKDVPIIACRLLPDSQVVLIEEPDKTPHVPTRYVMSQTRSA
jgi:hypothetical protein